MKKILSIIFILLGLGLIVFGFISYNNTDSNKESNIIEKGKELLKINDVIVKCELKRNSITLTRTLKMTHDYKPIERERLSVTDHSDDVKEDFEKDCKELEEDTEIKYGSAYKTYCKDMNFYSYSILYFDKLTYTNFEKDLYEEDLKYMNQDYSVFDYESYIKDYEAKGYTCEVK